MLSSNNCISDGDYITVYSHHSHIVSLRNQMMVFTIKEFFSFAFISTTPNIQCLLISVDIGFENFATKTVKAFVLGNQETHQQF